ncbi:hypothetical protein AB0A63_40445 [Lentzea sp. NPDC042327]|uniref:hypothetical protein n=1 Tax=Lentzea sp. NPDC042327 TaxID=3154801 RepID=UPI0033D3D7C2
MGSRRHLAPDLVDAVVERLMTGAAVTGALRSAVAQEHHTAVLTALAARYLLAPGVVTASVVGTGQAVRAQLESLTRSVPDLTHVAVRVLDGAPLDRDLVDGLHRTGIGLHVAATAAEAVFGANLVVVTSGAGLDTWPTHLPRGALLVNASGGELPAALTGAVDGRFVDDLALLSAACPQGRPVEADLRQVVTGERAGRTGADHVLLVDLLTEQRQHGQTQEEDHECRSRTRSSGSS